MSKAKRIKISEEVHSELKQIAQKNGLKLEFLGDKIFSGWLKGEVFFLPSALNQFNSTEAPREY